MKNGLQKKEVSFAWVKSAEMCERLQNWVNTNDKKKVTLWMKPQDKLRLLTVWAWQLKYHVEPEEIFDILIPIIRSVCKRQKYIPSVLGFRIAAMTGKAGERILQEALNERYPSGEHIQAWKRREQERQLYREKHEDEDGITFHVGKDKGPMQYRHLMLFLDQYKNKIELYKKEHEEAMHRNRLNYRGSPWQ